MSFGRRRQGYLAIGLGLLGLACGLLAGAWLLGLGGSHIPLGSPEARLLLWHPPIWCALGVQFLSTGAALLRGQAGAERRLRLGAWLVAVELLAMGGQYALAWPALAHADDGAALAWRVTLASAAAFGLLLLGFGVRTLPRG